MARSIKDLAVEVIQVQEACNLSGLVHGWSRAVTDLRAALPDAGTEQINTHPINQMWAAKLHELARMGFSDGSAFADAYDACKKLAAG